MRIGLFGGSFDPPHLGHLIFAEHARSALALDLVLFIPAAISPFKTEHAHASPDQRCEMVSLAIDGNEHFVMDIREVHRGGISYTIDTVRDAHATHHGDSLFLLMGADAFAEFPLWKHPDEIVRLVRLGVGNRPGSPIDPDAHAFGRYADVFSSPLIDIASRTIRFRVRAGSTIRYLVPPAIERYIAAHGLYHI